MWHKKLQGNNKKPGLEHSNDSWKTHREIRESNLLHCIKWKAPIPYSSFCQRLTVYLSSQETVLFIFVKIPFNQIFYICFVLRFNSVLKKSYDELVCFEMSKIPAGNVSLARSRAQEQEPEMLFQISKYELSQSFWRSEILAKYAVTYISVIQHYH